MAAAASRLHATDRPQDIIGEICRELLHYLDCRVFLCYLSDGDSAELKLSSFAGVDPRLDPVIESVDPGILRCDGEGHRPDATLECSTRATDCSNWAEFCRSKSLRTCSCHPLKVGTSLIGILLFGATDRADFTLEDLTLMRTVGEQIAGAVVRSRRWVALKNSEERYKDLVENVNSIILRFGRDGKIEFFNRAAQEFFGYEEAEIIGKDTSILLPRVESTGRNLEHLVKDVQESPDRYSESVNENVLKDGRRVWVSWRNRAVRDSSGRVVANIAVGQDITARKAVQEQLRLSEERFRKVFELAAVGMAQADPATGRFVMVNDRFCQIAGRTREELLRSTFADITHPDDRIVDAKNFRDLLDGKLSEYRREKRYLVDDGREVWVDVSVTLVGDRAGLPISTLGIIHDITARKQAEDSLRSTALELQTRNRMLRALSDSNHILTRESDERSLLQEICRIVVEECGYAMVWIGYAEADPEQTVRPVASAGFDEGYLETLRVTWSANERGFGPAGSAIRTALPSLCRNIGTDPKFTPWRDEALKRGYASSISLPLAFAGDVLGAISIYSREADPFSDDEVRLLMELANDLSQGISAIRLRAAHAEAQEAVIRSEERYRRFFEDDLTGDFLATPEGRILFCNPSFVKLFHFGSFEEALASDMVSLHTSLDSWQEFLKLIQEKKVLEQYECERRCIDGSPLHIVENIVGIFDDRGQLTQLKGYVYDDTERKLAEQALRENEHRLRLALEGGRMGTWQVDIETGANVWSDRVFDLLGLDPGLAPELTAGGILQFVHPEDRPRLQSLMKRAVEERTEFNGEFRVARPNGNAIWLAARARVVSEENGGPRIIGVLYDISQRKKMEADLLALTEGLEQMVSERTEELARTIRELEERALQLQRLTMELSEVEDRERRRLARILHDDLQQLLVGAKLHLDLLGNKLATSEDAEDLMARLRHLILESIDKSRGLSHELSPPALYQSGLRDALIWLGRRMQETCGLNVTVDVDQGADFGSETLRSFVYKAAQELLFNVVKHAGVSEARVRLRHRNGKVRLTVVDAGSGFDPESIGRTEGFGLFSIRERASLLGGWMKYRSTPKKGSVFVLVIPSD